MKNRYWDDDSKGNSALEDLSVMISSLLNIQSYSDDFETLFRNRDFISLWERMATSVQSMDRRVKTLQVDVGVDVDSLEESLHAVSAVIGRKPSTQDAEDSLLACPTIWDGLLYLQGSFRHCTDSLDHSGDCANSWFEV
jgi:hypothetical protein